ncbi:WD40-like beta propeller repeat domain-containing protein [Ditylenchus destructor]|nr:WD40-like beta propeller repeat domain-containing protein [Ditylenchus destructor]
MDIFRMDLQGKVQMQLTNETGFDGYGAVSPDGRWVVYTSMRTGDPELWIMNAVNGSGKRQLLQRKGFEGSASFSADSKKIIFVSTPTSTNTSQKNIYEKSLREYHYDSRNTSLYIMDIVSGKFSQILIDTQSLRIPKRYPDGIFDVKKMAHFSSPKFLDNGKIMFHACYNRPHDDIGDYRRVFVCFENGTGLEEIKIGSALDLPSAVLNNAETQIAFSSDIRELEASNHRRATLFIAKLISSETKYDSQDDVVSAEKQHENLNVINDTGHHFSGETLFSHVQQITYGGENFAPKFRLVDFILTISI